MAEFHQLDRYIKDHLSENLSELGRLCAQPSVSAQNWGLQECAALVGEMLQQRGFEVQIIPTGGAPVVFAERAGKSDRTLLFYNHYDVQPAEPLELWESPPFEPQIRDGKMYARGVSDDKGHLTSRLFALDALLAEEGELPCNVKFIIEGEEETSSIHLNEFVRTHQDLLAADVCVWEFGGVWITRIRRCSIWVYGVFVTWNCPLETAIQDVHSGLGGSIFPNAAWRLVWALNSLKGPDERIRIPWILRCMSSRLPSAISS
jgi:acetylornithine deacetylase/succinyl-diaminopimelate desuccinylase-like protein